MMLEAVRQIIQKFQLITRGQTLVVGVSGGMDSLALLHILIRLSPRLELKLHAATLDHQLRGEESAGDVRYVQQVCHEWGIELSSGQADVARLAREQRLGIEAAARLARYDFMAEVAHQVGALSIAVAHHADDQAETVLLHLLRGAGVHGLAGMALRAPVPGHVDLSLIRPLLRVARSEIEAYCQEHQIVSRHDSTNADTTLLRNAIRLEVLPYLEQYSPHVKPALARLAEIAATEDDYVQGQVKNFTHSPAVVVTDGRISIDREAFSELHTALQRRVFLWGAAQLAQTEDTSANLILDGIEIATRGRHGAVALLGGGVRLRVEYQLIIIESEQASAVKQKFPLVKVVSERVISIPSETSLGDWTLKISFVPPENNATFCKLAIQNGSQVVLRTRRDGDIFAPLGMNGHTQKLSRWMVNRKIPQVLRDRIPLLTVDKQVAAINVEGEWFISDSFAVRNTLERVIYFQFLENS